MKSRLSAEAKESIVKKALLRGDKTVAEIAHENGIGHSTLGKWIRDRQKRKDDKIPDRTMRFRHLQAVAALSEADAGAYCRRHGLYSVQLKEWEQDFMKDDISGKADKYRSENIELRKKNAGLERELRRKEKALAEAAALLVLKKKVEEIWGDDGDA